MQFELPSSPMRILVGCERHGRVRDAFRKRGHDAVSCDLLHSTAGGPHIEGDVLPLLREPWDMVIGFPPCPKLTVAAAWCFYHPDDKHLPYEERRPHPKFPNRRAEQDEAAEFFMAFANANAPKIAIENPVGVMSSRWRKPDQTVQPYEYGDDASKRTCLWLKGLPKLVADPAKRFAGRIVKDPRNGKDVERWSNQTDSGQNALSPSEDRWDKRSQTFQGIADAMADQWGGAL